MRIRQVQDNVKDRKPGAAAEPLVGPASTVLAAALDAPVPPCDTGSGEDKCVRLTCCCSKTGHIATQLRIASRRICRSRSRSGAAATAAGSNCNEESALPAVRIDSVAHEIRDKGSIGPQPSKHARALVGSYNRNLHKI